MIGVKQVGEPYTLGSSNNVFHIILDFIKTLLKTAML